MALPWGLSMIAVLAWVSQAAGAGPAIATDWDDLTLTQDECLARGEAAIRKLGVSEIEHTRYSRFGQTGDYTVAVRCVAEKGVVLFLASGPLRQRALDYQIAVHRSYLQ
jgi:hypothetical protein